MIPAGLNHFIQLYPQPLGNQPQSIAVFSALIDSGMFTLVKAVELAAGLCLLLGYRVPLMLIAVLPVSFTVWYWDTELQGWWTASAVYGWGVLGCNVFLCLAYLRHYQSMFFGYGEPVSPLGGTAFAPAHFLRCVLGVVLAATSLAYFLPSLLPMIAPLPFADPMTLRLLSAFEASGLLAVAKFILLAGGMMLVLNRAVPFALTAILCVLVCAAFMATLVEASFVSAALASALLALTAVLMLAYLPAYRAVLATGALADGEADAPGENYNSVFVDPRGTIPRRGLLEASLVLIAALSFYYWVVPFANGDTGLVVLALPSAILLTHLFKDLFGKHREAR